MFGNFDPVALGVVPSLARPGGNTTGLLISSEGTFAAKKLELLKEAVPQGRRIAMLVPDDPGILRQVQEVQNVASSLGVELMVTEVKEEAIRSRLHDDNRRAACGAPGRGPYLLRHRPEEDHQACGAKPASRDV